MSWLLWQAQGATRIASPRLVLRAAEVPLLREAQRLCEELAQMQRQEAQRIAAVLETARAEGHAQGLEQGRHAAREELSDGLRLRNVDRLHLGSDHQVIAAVREIEQQLA